MELVLGGPGCGKTTFLIEEVKKALTQGFDPASIGYFAFTKKAASEALTRACSASGLSPDDFLNMGTLHSMSFKNSEAGAKSVMSSRDFQEFSEQFGVALSPVSLSLRNFSSFLTDDEYMQTFQDARTQCVPLEVMLHDRMLEQERGLSLARAYEGYKSDVGAIDFTDMLEMFVETGHTPHLKLLIIDEAQDLSKLQWKVVHKLAANSDRVIVAGDDDQAIFEWAGADVRYFLTLAVDEIKVLEKSHRLKSNIHALCHRIATTRIEARYEKEFGYVSEGGNVYNQVLWELIDFTQGEFLFLARNRYLLNRPANFLRSRGFMYTLNGKSTTDEPFVRAVLHWENALRGKLMLGKDANNIQEFLAKSLTERRYKFPDNEELGMQDMAAFLGLKDPKNWLVSLTNVSVEEREYIREAKRNGESLINTPRITFSTIHGSKGGEADNVVLLCDLSKRSHDESFMNRSSAARVFYTGASRAKENLYIVKPETNRFYEMPL